MQSCTNRTTTGIHQPPLPDLITCRWGMYKTIDKYLHRSILCPSNASPSALCSPIFRSCRIWRGRAFPPDSSVEFFGYEGHHRSRDADKAIIPLRVNAYFYTCCVILVSPIFHSGIDSERVVDILHPPRCTCRKRVPRIERGSIRSLVQKI